MWLCASNPDLGRKEKRFITFKKIRKVMASLRKTSAPCLPHLNMVLLSACLAGLLQSP